jgi:hypothetical protein
MFTPTKFDMEFLIEQEIRPYCGPIFFARSLESADGNITANGSFGLIDTGQKKILVTCHHVWKDFQNAVDKDPDLNLCVCLDRNPPVILDQGQLIDQDKQLDIATFDIEPLLAACVGRKFYPLNQNSACRLKNGDPLAFVGYPGKFRSATDEGVQFGRMLHGVSVSDVSNLRVAAKISKAHGGISGTPCFLVRSGKPSLLVGFATEEGFGILWFTHAHCLNVDGTINKMPNFV